MKKRSIKMTNFDEIKRKWMKDPKFKREYDKLSLKYGLIQAIIDRRIKNGLTQKKLAKRIGTKQSSIARFESGRYNPTLSFVSKLADALDAKISVNL